MILTKKEAQAIVNAMAAAVDAGALVRSIECAEPITFYFDPRNQRVSVVRFDKRPSVFEPAPEKVAVERYDSLGGFAAAYGIAAEAQADRDSWKDIADRLNKVADQVEQLVAERDALRAENACLRGDTVEWMCKSCQCVHPIQRAGLMQPCPKCGSGMFPTSFNLRQIDLLSQQRDDLLAARQSVGVKYGKLVETLRNLDKWLDNSGYGDDHPWRGSINCTLDEVQQ